LVLNQQGVGLKGKKQYSYSIKNQRLTKSASHSPIFPIRSSIKHNNEQVTIDKKQIVPIPYTYIWRLLSIVKKKLLSLLLFSYQNKE
jgi:hypothetical protein